MEKVPNFNNFPPYMDNTHINDIYEKDPIFNPMMQYEQAFMYYRYLTCQMEYKIRCKEYEKMCKTDNRNDRRIPE